MTPKRSISSLWPSPRAHRRAFSRRPVLPVGVCRHAAGGHDRDPLGRLHRCSLRSARTGRDPEASDAIVSQDGRFVAFQSRSDGLYDGDDDRVSNVYVRTARRARSSSPAAPVALRASRRTTSATRRPSATTASEWRSPARALLDPARHERAEHRRLRARPGHGHDDSGEPRRRASARSGTGRRRTRAQRDGRIRGLRVRGQEPRSAANFRPARVSTAARSVGGNPTVLVSRRYAARTAVPPVRDPSRRSATTASRIAFTSDRPRRWSRPTTNTFNDIYVRDLAAGTTVLASRADGAGDVGNGTLPLAVDRRERLLRRLRVVARPSSTTTHDSDTAPDVYRRSLTAEHDGARGITAAGQKGNISTRPSLDDSGDVVGFVSSATALDPDDTESDA